MMRINKSGRTLCVSVVLLTVYSQTAYAQSSGGNFTITSQVVAAGGCGSDGSGGCTQSIGGNKLMMVLSLPGITMNHLPLGDLSKNE